MTGIASQVEKFRRISIQGACIDLVPYVPDYALTVVRLRNLPDVRYFLNQEIESTLDLQETWYENYAKRDDDIFWVLKDKSGIVVGCNRIYDMYPKVLEKGSLIVDPDFGRSLPIALEADLLALQFAFFEIGVGTVITRTRDDNIKMQSINSRFGFKETGQEILRGVPYLVYSLTKEDFSPEPFESIIKHWSRRNERRKT